MCFLLFRYAKNAASRAQVLDWSLEKRLSALSPIYSGHSGDDFRVTATLNFTDGWVHGFGLNHLRWMPYPVKTNVPHRGAILPPVVNPDPIGAREGERVCVKFANQGHTSHPMHVHGHKFQVVEIDGEALVSASGSGAVRDTLHVPPRCTSAVVCFEPRRSLGEGWMLHCHMLEHEFHGMSTTVQVS